MTKEPDWFRAELDPDLPAEERALLWSVADSLLDSRPYPRAAFHANLRERFAGAPARSAALARPPSLWARVVVLALPGTALLCVVAAGVAGAGPFAP